MSLGSSITYRMVAKSEPIQHGDHIYGREDNHYHGVSLTGGVRQRTPEGTCYSKATPGEEILEVSANSTIKLDFE